MPTPLIILIIMLIILIAMSVGLYFWGKRLEKQRVEQQKQIDANAMQVSLLIIDKKRMRLKDAGLPEQMTATLPWYAKRAKLPVVKVKAGPRIMNLIASEEIFDELPLKREVKGTVSGLYLTKVRGIRGKLNKEPVKKGFRARLATRLRKMQEKA